MKIDFNKLSDADKIAYKSYKANRLMAFCSLGAFVIAIGTLLYTRIDIENSNQTMNRVLNFADSAASAAKKSADFSERSAITAESSLKQSDKQFKNLNQSGLSYYDVSLNKNGMNVILTVQGKKAIKLDNIKYSVQFLPSDTVANFQNNSKLNTFYNDRLSTDSYTSLEGSEAVEINFPIRITAPTDSLYWNNADGVYLLNAKMDFTNLITKENGIFMLALVCEYSFKFKDAQDQSQCRKILEKMTINK